MKHLFLICFSSFAALGSWAQEPQGEGVAYKVELSTPYSATSRNLNIVDGDCARIDFSVTVLQDGTPVQVLQQNNVPDALFLEWQLDGELQKAEEDGSFLYQAACDAAKVVQKVTIRLLKDGEAVEADVDTLSFTVWPKPEVKLGDSETSPESPKKLFENESWLLTADFQGGNPEGWLHYWIEGNDTISSEKSFALSYDSSKGNPRFIALEVTNVVSGSTAETLKDTLFAKKYLYYAVFNPIIYSIEYESNKEETANNVVSGDSIRLKMRLVESNTLQQANDSVKFQWLTPNGKNEIVLKTEENNDTTTYEYIPHVICESGNEIKIDPFSYTAWPAIRVNKPDASWKMRIKDCNRNGQVIAKAIRSGNRVELDLGELTITGGYADTLSTESSSSKSLEFELRLIIANRALSDNTMPEDLNFKDGIYEDTLAYYAKNVFNDGTFIKEILVDTIGIKIYQRPDIPTRLQIKGNGTSGTWLVEGTDNLQMGYEEHSIAIDKVDANGQWFVSEASKSVSDKDQLYIYHEVSYPDGSKITSGKRFSGDRIDLNWDGSSYQSETRSGTETRIISRWSDAPMSVKRYRITGIQSAHLQPGLNIIRKEDGTMRKVFVK